MNKYKDNKGHFTTKENDGGECHHDSSHHPYLKQEPSEAVGSSLLLTDGNYFTQQKYGDHQELFNKSGTKRDTNVIQLRNTKDGRYAQIFMKEKPTEEQFESLKEWIDYSALIAEDGIITIEIEKDNDYQQFEVDSRKDLPKELIDYLKEN